MSQGARGAGLARDLMHDFAERTGVIGDRPPDRYLWTDAFAVCNFIGLGELDIARTLVEQVHHTLGRHRDDDPRQGWLDGNEDAHPTRGGLRIGKRLPERAPGEGADDRLEWDRDGQYFHYLTKWMHALDQLARATGEATFNLWARELADVAHRAFTRPGAGRMAWKMSIDLSHPLVSNMGQHDPLDGHVTCLQLQATASRLGGPMEGPRPTDAAADFAGMIPSELATTDPLGLGGLLTDAWRVTWLRREGWIRDDALLDRLVKAALRGLRTGGWERALAGPAPFRLAFRELGLAIGLAAVPLMTDPRGIEDFIALESAIESFWPVEEHRSVPAWLDHRNINDVMLATALDPSGYLAVDFSV